MFASRTLGFLLITAFIMVLTTGGCKRDLDILEPASYPTFAEVYTDGFGAGVEFQSFGDAKLDALGISFTEKYEGTSALQITVPSAGTGTGTYAGGALVAKGGRNLSGYNAITFRAKSSMEAKLSVIGMGNDNTGNSKFDAQRTNLPVHTSWSYYVLPIPDGAKLTMEKGLFYFAIANISGVGFTVWMDEIKYENLSTIQYPRFTVATRSVERVSGDTVKVENPVITFNVNGADYAVQASSSFLTGVPADSSVVSIDKYNVITATGQGTTDVTFKLGSVKGNGKVTVTTKVLNGPTTAPAAPTADSASVISLLGTKYRNRTVSTWAASWGTGTVADTTVAGTPIKLYKNLGFAGIDFSANQIDASEMTHLRMDLWTAYPTAAPAAFKVKLVDFGPDGRSGSADDSEQEVSVTASSTPPISTGSWVSLNIPLGDFALSNQSNLAQIIISGDLRVVWLANMYFFKGTGTAPTVPRIAPPRPTQSAANVVSLQSNYYSNIPVETWAAQWEFSTAKVADRVVAGENVKYYTTLNFAGIVLPAPIDVSTMTHFRMDFWTALPVTSPNNFKILLADFGPNGVFGGGDDSQHELTFTATSTPALKTGEWVSIDIPLSSFTGLTRRANLAQLVISGSLPTVWIGNVFFYKGSTTVTGPTTPAPTPTLSAASVISMFSNAYTNVNVNTWSAVWDQADLTDTTIAGNNVKLYRNLVYAGIEATTTPINASAMTHFHMDIWTPNATASPVVFKIKIVDFGANGVFAGGDDVEHELTFSATTTPALVTGSWISFDIPLSNFTGLTTKAHIAQLIISGGLSTVWVDNVYFHR